MPKPELKTKVSNVHQGSFTEDRGMKRLLALILVWTLLVITGTLVSADGKTRGVTNVFSQQSSIKNLDKMYSNKTEAK